MAVNTALEDCATFYGLSVQNALMVVSTDTVQQAVIPLERIQTLMDQLEEATLVAEAIEILKDAKNPVADFGGKIGRYGESSDVRHKLGAIFLYCAVDYCVEFLERDVKQLNFNDDLKHKVAVDILCVLSGFSSGDS